MPWRMPPTTPPKARAKGTWVEPEPDGQTAARAWVSKRATGQPVLAEDRAVVMKLAAAVRVAPEAVRVAAAVEGAEAAEAARSR